MTDTIVQTEICMFSYGTAINGAGPLTYQRAKKYIDPSLYSTAVYYLEASYLNQQAANATIDLMDPDGLVVMSLSLPTTGGGGHDPSVLTRFRSSSFTLTKTGVYNHRFNTTTNQCILYSLRIIIVQTNPIKTVIEFPIFAGGNASYNDLGGIAGGDLFRTLSGTYVAGTGLNDINFKFFYYVASEWVGLKSIILEFLSDGFSASESMALFDFTTGIMVTGGEGINPSNNLATILVTIDPVNLIDGHLYEVRVKSGTPGSANAFFYGAWLKFVMQKVNGTMKGNIYYKIGDNELGEYRSLLPLSTVNNARLETCCRGGSRHISVIDAGAVDVGAGSEIAATIVNVTSSDPKTLLRSPADIYADIPSNHRVYSSNASGSEAQSFALSSFTVPPKITIPFKKYHGPNNKPASCPFYPSGQS